MQKKLLILLAFGALISGCTVIDYVKNQLPTEKHIILLSKAEVQNQNLGINVMPSSNEIYDHRHYVFCDKGDFSNHKCKPLTKKTRYTEKKIKKISFLDNVKSTREKKADINNLDTMKKVFVINFDWAKSELSNPGKKWIEVNQQYFDKKNVVLIGYTDSTKTGKTKTSNSTISKKRVNAVLTEMQKYNINVLYTESKPLCCYVGSNETKAGRAKNRRVEIYTIKKRRK